MSYATQTDLINQFGEAEVIAISDRNLAGVVDTIVVEGGLQRASDTMDSYLASRYPLPLAVVPQLLVDICCDIARYKLLGVDATETEAARNRYRDALKMLEQIRDGKLDIGLTVSGQTTPESVSVQVAGGGRKFDRTTLSDY